MRKDDKPKRKRSQEKTSDDLNARQEVFAYEYLKDFNGTKAAIRAGYAESGAHVEAHYLLKHHKVQQIIQARLHEVDVTATRVLGELVKVAYSDMGDYGKLQAGGAFEATPFDELEPGATRAIKKVKEKRKILSAGEGEGDNIVIDSQYEFELHDKMKALELLGKHLGMFKDSVQLSGSADTPVEIVFRKPDANSD